MRWEGVAEEARAPADVEAIAALDDFYNNKTHSITYNNNHFSGQYFRVGSNPCDEYLPAFDLKITLG